MMTSQPQELLQTTTTAQQRVAQRRGLGMGMGFSELLQLEYSRATLPSPKASFCENKEREGYPSILTTLQLVCDKGMGKWEGKEALPVAMLAVEKEALLYLFPTQHPQLNCVLLKVPDLTTVCMVHSGHPPLGDLTY